MLPLNPLHQIQATISQSIDAIKGHVETLGNASQELVQKADVTPLNSEYREGMNRIIGDISQNSQNLADAVNRLTRQIDSSGTSKPPPKDNVHFSHFSASSIHFLEGKQMEDNTLDFNFWPSFSDLMLTLVLILVIVVFAVIAAFSIGTDDLRAELEETKEEMAKVKKEEKAIAEAIAKVKEKQEEITQAIAKAYNVKWEDVKKPKDEETETDSFMIPIHLEDDGSTEIVIHNEATLQRYSFSDRILFEPDRYDLNEKGRKTLLTVGRQIQNNLTYISEIQIQGHADPDRPAYVPSNLHLGALRAIEVYKFLQERIQIDPAKHLMSATSFGEYKPVQRSVQDSTYTQRKLTRHNRTRELKAKNRRMEILLFYRLKQAEK